MGGNKRSRTETDNNDGSTSGQGQGQIQGSIPQRRHVKTKNNPSGSASGIRPPPEAYNNAPAHSHHAFAGNNLLSGSVKPPPGTYHGVVDKNNDDDNVNRALAETCQKLYHGHGQGGGADLTEVVSAMLVVDVRRMKVRNPHYPLNSPLLSVVSRESLAAINNGPTTDKNTKHKTSAKKATSNTAPRALEHLMSPTSTTPSTTTKFQFGAGPAAGTTTTAAPSSTSSTMGLFLASPAMPPPPTAAQHPPFTFGSAAGAGSTGGTTTAFSFSSAPSTTTTGFFLGATGGGTGEAPAAAAPAASFSFSPPPAAAVARTSGLPFQPPPANNNINAAGTANGDDDGVANDEGVVDDEPSSITEVIEEGWTLIKSFDGVDVKRSLENNQGYVRVRTGQLMVQQAVATGKKRLVMKDLADTFLNMVIVATPRFTAAAGGNAGKPDHIFLLGDNILAADKAAGGKQMIVLKLHPPYSQELFDLMKIQ
jgi:hypothetical protein